MIAKMNKGLTIYQNFTGDTLYSLQVHQKRPNCPTCDNTFIALSDYLHPFMFTRAASAETLTTFTIKDVSDTVIETIPNNRIEILNAGSIDYIYCNFNRTGVDSIPCGLYYYELTFDTEVYYSEIFRVIDKDIDFKANNIAVNGEFTTNLSGWTTTGTVSQITTGGSGAAQLSYPSTMYQNAPGESFVKIEIVTIAGYTAGMYFSYGGYTFNLPPNTTSTFYVPSGVRYTIGNDDAASSNDLTVSSVRIYEIEKVSCYNLIVNRSSCNKNSIPYSNTAYTDVFIFDAELAEPTYPTEIENDQDGNRNKVQTFLKVLKQWEMLGSSALYEPLVDEFHKLPLNNCIYIFNDIWKKEFKTFEETLDIAIDSEWNGEDRCNALVKLTINETLVVANACCETMPELECCEAFGWDLDAADLDAVVLTLAEPFCLEGTLYYLDAYSSGTLVSSTLFEDTITFSFNIIASGTFFVRSVKFGCPDIEYDLNVS